MTVSVLVPFGSDCVWRHRAWGFVKARYEANHPDWEVIEGNCDGEWSKGAALADALSRASGDVLVLADADSYLEPDVLPSALEQLDEHHWISPHFMVLRLGIAGTRRVYRGEPVHRGHTIRLPYPGLPGGGITVVTRAAYEAVGGVDPRFRGWGGEDISLAWALETLVGPGGRLTADLWHLWHPHPAPDHHGSPESEALAGRYREARGNVVRMSALIQEVSPCSQPSRTSAPSSIATH